MPTILVAYHTFHGHTERIARRIAAALEAVGHSPTVLSIEDPRAGEAIAAHDAVIVGGAIHRGRHSRGLERFARAHAAALSARPNAFYSVSLSAAGPAEKVAKARRWVEEFCARTGWPARATSVFGGALQYRDYNPFLRAFIRILVKVGGHGDTDTSRNHEYTDWQAVERFASRFASQLEVAGIA